MRLVQVGIGGFGQRWAREVQSSESAELIAVVDPEESARAWAVGNLGLTPENCVKSLEQAIHSLEWDAALVVTPPETHHAVASEALRAGKHVLLEKPLATSLNEAHDLVNIAARAERTLMVSQNYRFRRPARAVQHLISSGSIGKLLAVNVACRRDTRQTFPPGNFRYEMRHPFVLDMAIHHVDLIRALTGQDIKRVFARSWRAPDSSYRFDPAVHAIFVLGGDVTVTYEGDWAARGSETSWNGEWELTGELGRILWIGGEADATQGEVLVQKWGQDLVSIEQPVLAAADQAGTLHEFVTAIEEGRTPEASAADNVLSLATVLACVESIESGESVSVPGGMGAVEHSER
jgi:predicted dehydrogenase